MLRLSACLLRHDWATAGQPCPPRPSCLDRPCRARFVRRASSVSGQCPTAGQPCPANRPASFAEAGLRHSSSCAGLASPARVVRRACPLVARFCFGSKHGGRPWRGDLGPSKTATALPTQPTSCFIALGHCPASCAPCFCQGRCVLWPWQGNCARPSSQSSAVLVRLLPSSSLTGQCPPMAGRSRQGRPPAPPPGPARLARQAGLGFCAQNLCRRQIRLLCLSACSPASKHGGRPWRGDLGHGSATVHSKTASVPPSRLRHAFPRRAQRCCQTALPQRPTRCVERPTRGVLLSDDLWPPTKPPLGCSMQTTSVCVMLL